MQHRTGAVPLVDARQNLGVALDQLSNRSVVLASGSIYRLGILREVGIEAVVDPPELDERALDHRFVELGPGPFAVELARLKVGAVLARHADAIVIAGDQVGVLDIGRGPVMLTKQPDVEAATAQLVAMSGTTHRLVNGLVVTDTASGATVAGIDVQRVTMRPYSEAEARAYVTRFEPFDTAGSYRIEDGEQMEGGRGLVQRVEGEHPSGVIGLPLPLLGRLLADVIGL